MKRLTKSSFGHRFLSKTSLPLLIEHRLSEVSYNRLLVIIILFALAFSTLIVRLCSIIIFSGEGMTRHYVHNTNIQFHRKEITDRNGVLLAVNLDTPSLYVNPKLIESPENLAKKLAKIFPSLTKDNLLKSFKSNRSFVWIKRNITPKQQYAVNSLGIPALGFKKGQKRIYPHGSLLSHVLGFVGTDGKGLAGIEKFHDSELLIEAGDGKGKAGKLKLSIDIRAQNIVHEELKNAIEEYDAEGAIGIVTNANTGEIYSLVSLPDFDPHNPGKAKGNQLFNRATLGVYELGSIFKICSMAMALESKLVALNDVYYVKNPIKASRFSITDYSRKGNWLSVPEIFMYSSNIGTARISLDLGKKLQQKFLKSFGLLDPMNIELFERGKPLFPSKKEWSDIHTMTISYGHGIAITPLHMSQTAAAIVNGGYLYPSTLIKIENDIRIKAKRVLHQETSEKMRRLLRLVIKKGTGRKANVAGYLVGGKSGSAEKSIKGGYSKREKLSSFIAAFPIHKPEYTVLVVLDNPQSKVKYLSATGGRAAAPVAGKIISRIGPLLGIQPMDENDPEIQEKLWIDYKTDADALESF